jgi:hypothetical protein
MRCSRLLPSLLLAVGLLSSAVPASPQEGPRRRTPRGSAGRRVALTVGDLTLQLPEGWKVGRSSFTNTAVIYNAPGGEREPARIVVRTEPRTSYTEALSRLQQIARETSSAPEYSVVGGWPALEQESLVLKEMPGQRPGGESGDEMTLRLTFAIAVGRTLVRLDASLPPEREEELGDQIREIAQSARFPTRGDPGRVEADVERLRSAPPSPSTREPRSALPAAPSPETTVTLSDEDAGVGAPLRAISGGSEISIAVSDDGQDVVVATNSGYVASDDAGETFTGLRFPTFPGTYFRVNGDPSVAVGLSGSFYYALIGFPTSDGMMPPSAAQNSTAISVSTDGGQNFTFRANAVLCQGGAVPGMPGPGLCFADQEHIAADRFNAGGGGGDQVYSTWRNFDGMDQDPGLVCSQDSGFNWTAPLDVGPGARPRIGVGQDGFVYVIYLNGNNVEVRKYSSCANGLALQMGFPQVVDTINEVSCPVPGLDRCTGRNTLASYTVAVDDTDPSHVYAAYAMNTVSGVNEDVVVRDSPDGGSSWPQVVQLHPIVNARRFMPWLCVVGGTAHVTWYDTRFATMANNDLTDFFRGSAFLDGMGNLVAGPEVQITDVSDPLCASGWPCATDRISDAESCSVQPQPAGVCFGTPTPANPRGVACDFSDCDVCSGGSCLRTGGACAMDSDCSPNMACACASGMKTCVIGRGCPKYGDYNYIACGAGRVYTAWASATAPLTLPPSPGNRVDTFFDVELVCCVPRIEAPEDLALPDTCAGDLGTADLEVCNTGFEDLEISGIASLDGQFSVPAAYPVTIAAGDCETFTAEFEPTSRGPKAATLTISSDDPVKPEVEVSATGTGLGIVSITCPADLEAPNDPGLCSAVVDPGMPTWDAEGCPVDITSLRSDGLAIVDPYPVGMTTITWTATDGGGNGMSCPQVIVVNDVEPPEISNQTATPDTLWPPNHKMVDVTVDYEVMDNCDALPLITCELDVTSNEPVNGRGDGNTEPDWVVHDEHQLDLRAERAGGGSGRVYTPTITCADTEENASQAETMVTVPKSKGKNK